MNSVQQQINSLREVLNRYNYEYYVLDHATISDYEFDMKLKELEALEAAYRILQCKFSHSKSRWNRYKKLPNTIS